MKPFSKKYFFIQGSPLWFWSDFDGFSWKKETMWLCSLLPSIGGSPLDKFKDQGIQTISAEPMSLCFCLLALPCQVG